MTAQERQLIDGGRKWFDKNAARLFEESTFFDGRNHISIATGSQWEHEELWRSKGGTWVQHTWSQRQASAEDWSEISEARAHAWLLKHGHYDALPANVVADAEV